MTPAKFHEINQAFSQLDPNSSLGLILDYSDLVTPSTAAPQNPPNAGLTDTNDEHERDNLSSTPSSSTPTQKPVQTSKIEKQKKLPDRNCFFHWSLKEEGEAECGWIGKKLSIGDQIIPTGKLKKKTSAKSDSDNETKNTKGPSL